MDEILFQVTTPLEYDAILKQRNWERHQIKRPEIAGQLGNVESCLRSPQVVIRDSSGCDHYYSLGFGAGNTANSYLHVLVRKFDTDPAHTVVSAWFTRVLRKGDKLWPKNQ